MKALRILLSVVIVLAALAAILIILALTPSIQTWAVRKAVAGQPGLKLDVKRVSAGFSSADISDLHLVKDGLVVTASHVHAKYSAWDYIAHHRVTVDDLTATDLVVDARNSAPAPTSAPSADTPRPGQVSPPPAKSPNTSEPAHSFDGLLNGIRLPFDLQIARFSIPGRALLADDQTAVFEVHGSDITTGKRGTVDWKADVAAADPKAAFRALHTNGTATVHITTERRIDVLEINAITSAEGPNFPSDQIKLEGKAEQPAAGGNEGYTANVSLVRDGTSERLATLAGQYDASVHEITGVWTVSVRPDQLTAVLTGFGLPDISAEGAGKFALNPDGGKGSATGNLRATVSHPEKISPDLAPIGRLDVAITFNGGLADKAARLEQLAIDAITANGRKLAQIRTLQPVGFSLVDKRVTFTDAKADLARITIDGLPLAWAQPFAKPLVIDSGQASMVLAVAGEPDGSHVRVTPVEPLTLRNVTVRNGAQKLADNMTLSVKPRADYSADHVAAELDEISMSTPTGDTVTGKVTAEINHLTKARTVAFTTDTQAKFVAMLKPYLNVDTGPMTVATKSEGTLAGQTLHFTHSSTRITRDNGQLIASIDLEQPITLDLPSKAVTSANPDAQTLRVAFGQVPLAWAQGFVANSKLEGDIVGGTLGVTVRSMNDLTASVTQPITLRRVSVTMNNQPMLQQVDVTADFTATKHGEDVTYNVRRIEAKHDTATLLSLAAAGEAKLAAKPAISAKGTLTGDLGALAQQPIAASSDSLASGKLDASFDANIGDTIQAKAMVTASNLTARQGNRPLGTAVLDASATVQSDGSSVLKVPFTLTNGARKSDLTLDGKLGRSGNTITFNGTITSTLLVIDDLKPLAALAPSSKPAAGSPTERPAVPAVSPSGAPPPRAGENPPASVATAPASSGAAHDTVPFWSAANGKIDLDLKQITFGTDYVISNVRGTAILSPTRLALNPLDGNLRDKPFKVAATIDFDGAQAQPYTLAANVNIPGIDIGAILQAANPNEKPQLETNVTVDAKINGKGTTAANLAQNAYGTFDVAGSKGVLRVLGQKAGTAVTLGSLALGLAGGKSDTASAIAELAAKFAELPFDKFTMHVDRGADLNLNVSHLEFLSSDARISGSGGIKNVPGVPIQKQPMQFTLQLGAKDDIAVLLNRLHALNGKQDEQGYYMMSRSFTVGGTPSSGASTDLWKILAQIGADAVLPNVLQMFGH